MGKTYNHSKRPFLNKIRFKQLDSRGYWRGYVLVCERCCIKDGISAGWGVRFGTCSYCGRETRVTPYGDNYRKTIARQIGNSFLVWHRPKGLWKDHSLGRKK